MEEILLLDNGSRRPQSTLALRALAGSLAVRLGQAVQPVSLAQADQIPPDQLDGQPAQTLESWLAARRRQGGRDFLVLPLFFGASRALTQAIPDLVTRLAAELGPLDLRLADTLCPLPAGEPRLTALLVDLIAATRQRTGLNPGRLVLVDHGSPSARVNAVRRWVAADMQSHFGQAIRVEEAAMERRGGTQYDFNGELLSAVLRRLAAEDPADPIFLVPLFLFAGRHAGPGGDLDEIAAAVKAEYPSLRVAMTGLVGDHPALLEILVSRYHQARGLPP